MGAINALLDRSAGRLAPKRVARGVLTVAAILLLSDLGIGGAGLEVRRSEQINSRSCSVQFSTTDGFDYRLSGSGPERALQMEAAERGKATWREYAITPNIKYMVNQSTSAQRRRPVARRQHRGPGCCQITDDRY